SFILYKGLMAHLEGKSLDYKGYLIAHIHRTIFNNINVAHDGWDYFPEQWKVKENNLQSDSIAYLFLKYYLEWARDKIGFDKEYDSDLEEVSRQLFPEVSMSAWSEIVTYIVRSWGENRAKSLLAYRPNFGIVDFVWSGDYHEDTVASLHAKAMDEGFEKTVSLTYKVFFPRGISESDIREAIDYFHKADTQTDEEKVRKDELLKIFTGLQEYIKDKDSESSVE